MNYFSGIGSGYPIGGIASKKTYFNQMTKNALGSTYGGNVVCCAAANATLDVLFGENLMQNSVNMGAYLRSKLENLRDNADGRNGGALIKDIRHKGLLMGVDIDPKIPVGSIVKKASEEQRLIMHTCGKNSIRVIPALNIGEPEMDEFVAKLQTILIELERDGATGAGLAATM